MKMAVRMPDAMKIERDEIDENDWAQIKVVIEEGLNNIMTFRKDEGIVRKKISIAYWEYSTVHD
jgi:anti-sigma regulatory factor (Ser/Thr protein kinase)